MKPSGGPASKHAGTGVRLVLSVGILGSCLLAACVLPMALAWGQEEAEEGFGDELEPVLSPSLERAIREQVDADLDVGTVDAPPPLRMPTLPGHRAWGDGDGYARRTSALYCPSYLPELYPEKNLDELCREDYFSSPWLFQQRRENPFLVALEQFELLTDSVRERRRRLPWALAYAYLHHDYQDWAADTVQATLSRRQYIANEVSIDVVGPWILSVLPEFLSVVEAGEGQVPIDVRVFSNASYDSVASTERMLVKAAERGVKAVAVADRSRTDGALWARRVAERLRREEKLPRDFLVIPGQVVTTHTGGVLSLFTEDIIPDGMTMERVVSCIHRQGGLAYMVHPGVPGGPERLANRDFDGYLIQPGMFEMFRTLTLLNDPRLESKPGLTASNSQYSGTVGLPYTLVEAEEVSAEAIKRGLASGEVYAAGGLYLPWMTAASFPPLAKCSSFFNRYFMIHRYAEKHVAEFIGADSVSLSTSWDSEVRSMMGVTGAPAGARDLLNGDSPLLEGPRLGFIAAEYSFFRIGYDRPADTAFLEATITW